MKTQEQTNFLSVAIAPIVLLLLCALPTFAQTREEKLALAEKNFNEAMVLFNSKRKNSSEKNIDLKSAIEKFNAAAEIFRQNNVKIDLK